MSLKKSILFGAIATILLPSYVSALDIDIPGADSTIAVDKYQQYRADTEVEEELKTKTKELLKESIPKEENIDAEIFKDLEYLNNELNLAARFSSTVVILKENGADVKFTSDFESIVGVGGKGSVEGVISGGLIKSLITELGYEVREQKKGNNWENTNIPYNKLNSTLLEEQFANSNESINPAGAKMDRW